MYHEILRRQLSVSARTTVLICKWQRDAWMYRVHTICRVSQSITSLDSRQCIGRYIYLYNAQYKKERKASELTDQSVTQSSSSQHSRPLLECRIDRDKGRHFASFL